MNVSSVVQQLYERYASDKSLLREEWECNTKSVTCPFEARSPAKGQTLVERLRESWQHLLRDRATRPLTYNDEQFHVLERIKVQKFTFFSKMTKFLIIKMSHSFRPIVLCSLSLKKFIIENA